MGLGLKTIFWVEALKPSSGLRYKKISIELGHKNILDSGLKVVVVVDMTCVVGHRNLPYKANLKKVLVICI